MDIARPELKHKRKVRRIIYGAAALVVIGALTLALARLKPAAPTVDKASVWTDTVKHGPMLREVRGIGVLVPVNIQWIAAESASRVDKIVLQSGASVKPTSVVLELSDPQLQNDTINADFAYKASEADLATLKASLANSLAAQKSAVADVESQYQQAKLQADADKQLFEQGLGPEITAKKSAVAAEQLAIKERLSQDQLQIADDAAQAQIASQQAHVEQQRALYELKKSQQDSLHVRAGLTGVLSAVSVDVGQQVTPGTNLIRVADPSQLKATIQIAETEAKDLAIGQKASTDTHNGIVEGHVTRVDAAVVNGMVAVDVTLDGKMPPGARPDLSVEGTIEIERLTDVLNVGRPVHGDADSTVGLFKLTADGDAVRVPVKLGRTSVNAVEILQGLQTGDQVILSDMSAWDSVDRVRLR